MTLPDHFLPHGFCCKKKNPPPYPSVTYTVSILCQDRSCVLQNGSIWLWVFFFLRWEWLVIECGNRKWLSLLPHLILMLWRGYTYSHLITWVWRKRRRFGLGYNRSGLEEHGGVVQGESCCCCLLWIYGSKTYSHLLFSDNFLQFHFCFCVWTEFISLLLRKRGIEVGHENVHSTLLGRCLFHGLVFSLVSLLISCMYKQLYCHS